jgi:hypothetical protein
MLNGRLTPEAAFPDLPGPVRVGLFFFSQRSRVPLKAACVLPRGVMQPIPTFHLILG